jgi:hypothetical protein
MKQIYEQFPEFIKNTTSYVTSFGKRIPDFINDKVIGEIKYVNYQYLSSQIKGMIEIAREQGKKFILVIDEAKTTLSAPLTVAIAKAEGEVLRVASSIGKGISSAADSIVVVFKSQIDFFNILRQACDSCM